MTNQVQVFGKNMDVTDNIHDYVSDKAENLDRYLKEIDNVRVDLSYVKSARSATDRQVAQITVQGPRILLRTEERADDILAAFDTAFNKMKRQIERYKGKQDRGRGDGRSAAEVVSESLDDDFENEGMIIARSKKFTVYPMVVEEAYEQMQLLEHDNFFIFYNGDTNAINVLYRRRDGSYGLIEPEIA
ncbi:MAG: ribosome-associated translation inhibitor RaiA [Anaerolineae bacterium]|jgi:putative sigma-54 modulation protein|nr:ribosome-associated translation inhibitor RaiA [Anaerolineae bacterium]MBT7074989.1 ribosome-associated translation inhibitor RaiA [Anaerolineae bacterium]MBT7782512.1 ribosome-associated translation inhibitor RaiA [Anaerolineae bacterium]